MANFKLFMGCLGSGITICNSAVEENHDYKQIAHIRNCGKIHWYIGNPAAYVPVDDMKKIEKAAERQKEKFNAWCDSMPELKIYEILLDMVPYTACDSIFKNPDSFPTISDKINFLKKCVWDKA